MTPPRESQPPAMPYQPPAHLQLHVDMLHRIVRFSFRGSLDLATSTLDLPLHVLKQVAGQVAQFEGHAEAQGPRN